jgi:putative acetyltransferase
MNQRFAIKRTTTADDDFQLLVTHLDNELWNELKEDQATYDQYNKVPDIKTAVVLYDGQKPIAIGCFKVYEEIGVEIKRMFVEKEYRGNGCSKQVLKELEKWAMEEGFSSAVLETSIHFATAQILYMKAGYKIIDNYGQYTGLKESVCMQKNLKSSSEELAAIKEATEENESGFYKKLLNPPLGERRYFDFEEDFVEENVRCIPMIVRFKMDAVGIKLKLAEWSKFKVAERISLAILPTANTTEAAYYNQYLTGLISKHTNEAPTSMSIEAKPVWSVLSIIPDMLQEKANECGCEISMWQWQQLSNLQRFTLLKLCRPGHENKNFPKAMKEFGLAQ